MKKIPIKSLAEFYQPNLFSLIGLTILLFICGSIFLLRSYRESESQRIIFFCYAFTMIMYGFARMFFIFADYYQAIYWGQDSEPYFFWTTLAYSVGTASLIPILFVLEKYLVLKTKGIFTTISIIIFLFSVVSVFGIISKYLSQYVVYAGLLVIIICIFSLYIYLIRITEGSVRDKAIGVFIGLIILILGMILDAQITEFLAPGGGFLNQIRLLIGSSLMISGVSIFNWFQLKK
ncbi:MAG: hypothetical protein HWN67_17335 [Candidatus Helarchaeota archaeon]|nr:hypothetical protein [Candidatus Helarchaeota archaeon]